MVIDGEVDDAAPKLQEFLSLVAVAPVLLNGIRHGLLREAVLEPEGGKRQAVDKETQVERQLGLVAAVAQLSGDAEAVSVVEGLRLLVPRRGRAVEEREVVRTMLDAVAEDVDDAALADLSLKPSQELPAGGAVLVQTQGVSSVSLGRNGT